MENNFFHAFWIDEICGSDASGLLDTFERILDENGIAVTEKEGIFSAMSGNLPLMQIGAVKNNVVGVRVGGRTDQNTPEVPDIGYVFGTMRNLTEGLYPDLIIEGVHNCMIGCDGCCDTAPIEHRTGRRYCAYHTEVGGYCLSRIERDMPGREQEERPEEDDECCERFFCSLFSEPYSVNRFSGPHGSRPLIGRVTEYDKPRIEELVNVVSRIEQGERAADCVRDLQRGREVLKYRESFGELKRVLERHGIRHMIDISSREQLGDIEKSARSMGFYHRCREPIMELYEWMGMVEERKPYTRTGTDTGIPITA